MAVYSKVGFHTHQFTAQYHSNSIISYAALSSFIAKQHNSFFLPRLIESGGKIFCLESAEQLQFKLNKN